MAPCYRAHRTNSEKSVVTANRNEVPQAIARAGVTGRDGFDISNFNARTREQKQSISPATIKLVKRVQRSRSIDIGNHFVGAVASQNLQRYLDVLQESK